MKIGVLFTVAVTCAVLFAYILIEWRINQRSCPECGSRVSKDNPDEFCPRCAAPIAED